MNAPMSPGWYPDPYGTYGLDRWWDGNQWSEATQPSAYPGGGMPPPPPPPKSGSPLPWILGGLGALVVVALVAAMVVFLSNRSESGPAATTDRPAVPSEQPTTDQQPPQDQQPTTDQQPPQDQQRVNDTEAGLSYAVVDGWEVQDGGRQNPVNPWNAGYQKLSQENYKPGRTWTGSVRSGSLADRYEYSGDADLQKATKALFGDIEGKFFPLRRETSLTKDEAVTVDGKKGWQIKFKMTFPDASTMNLKFKSEEGAVTLVDRGDGKRPGVLYISIPDNLDTANVDKILTSLKAA